MKKRSKEEEERGPPNAKHLDEAENRMVKHSLVLKLIQGNKQT